MGPRACSPRMLRLMTRYADYWTAFNVSSLETYRPMRDAVNAACLDAGRDPMTLARTVTVAIDLPGLEACIDPNSPWWNSDRASCDRPRGIPEPWQCRASERRDPRANG